MVIQYYDYIYLIVISTTIPQYCIALNNFQLTSSDLVHKPFCSTTVLRSTILYSLVGGWWLCCQFSNDLMSFLLEYSRDIACRHWRSYKLMQVSTRSSWANCSFPNRLYKQTTISKRVTDCRRQKCGETSSNETTELSMLSSNKVSASLFSTTTASN